MMARPYRNVIRIQYGGYIMGMHTVHSEGEYPAVLCSIRRSKDPDAGDFFHFLKGQYGQFIFSLLQLFPADFSRYRIAASRAAAPAAFTVPASNLWGRGA